tara:strand:- start:1966 stop:2715 length:750 start_codon:yes stop_codon:yes gene_type:complete
MPNFTIQRVIESGYTVGCTNFETNQYEGDTASLVSGSPLDGSIVWELNADTGWTVDIANFEIAGTIPTSYPQTSTVRTFQNDPNTSPSIAPVNGIVMEQVTTTSIKITLYLHPEATYNISGVPFEMPPTDVTTNILIQGCATPKAARVNVHMRNAGTGDVDVTASVSNDFKTLVEQGSAEGEFHIAGHVPREDENKELLSYTITAKEGERFVSTPNFSLSTKDNYTKSSITKDDSGNIVSMTVRVFKRL